MPTFLNNNFFQIFLELGRVEPAGLLGLLVVPVAGLIPRVFFTASAAPCAMFFTCPPVYTPKSTINMLVDGYKCLHN